MTALIAPSVAGASIPVTLTTGLLNKPRGDAAGADQRLIGFNARQFPEVGLSELGAVPVEAGDALDAGVTIGIAHGGQQHDQSHERVRGRAAEHPRVHRSLQRAALDHDPTHPAQSRGERGFVEPGVAHVRDHDRVGCKYLRMFTRVVREGSAPLLIPLDNHPHGARGFAVERAHQRGVHDHAGLVVGSTSPIQAPFAHGRFEGRREPQGFITAGLYVVVGVQQHRL